MIRIILLTITLAAGVASARAQILTGRWEGSFRTGIAIDVPISIEFKLNADSTYSIYTYTRFNTSEQYNQEVIAEADYDLVGTYSIYITEIAVVNGDGAANPCFQRMRLRFRKNKKIMLLEGAWNAVGRNCYGEGRILLTKKRNKPVQK